MDTVTLWACSDCTMALVNDDTTGIDNPDRLAEILAGVARFQMGELTPGLMYAEHNAAQCVADYMGGIDPECDGECERIGFTWSPCDVCLSTTVAGSRDAFTLWPIETETD